MIRPYITALNLAQRNSSTLLVIMVWCLLALNAFGQESLSIAISDYDETVSNTHSSAEQSYGESEGSYETSYFLFRVQKTDLLRFDDDHNLIELETLPNKIEIGLRDHREIKELLAKDPRTAGGSFKSYTLESGEIIFPSLYYLDENFSYENFRSTDPDVNNLIITFDKSVKKLKKLKAKKKDASLFGIARHVLELGLSLIHISEPTRPY